MLRKRKLGWVGAALAGGLALAAPAMAFNIKAHPEGVEYTSPGVTDDSIKIGLFGPLSGPQMATGADNLRLHMAWFDKINEQGGIWGRKIEYIVEDDKCTAEGVTAAVKKLVEEDKVFMLHGGSCSASLYGVRDYIERNEVPYIVLNATADLLAVPPSPYITTSVSIAIHHVAGASAQFAAEHLGAKKIAYIRHDDAYGDWATTAVNHQLEGTDVTVTNAEAVSANLTDVTAPLMKIRASQPDALIIYTYPRLAALIIKRAHELGLTMPIILSATGTADIPGLTANVANDAAFANLYYQDTINDLPTGPKQKWVRDLFAQKYPDIAKEEGRPTNYFSNDVGGFLMVTYGLLMAGPVPTREAFVKATQNMWFETGSQAGPIIVSEKDRTAQRNTTFLKYDVKSLTPVEGSWASKWDFSQAKP